MVGKNNLKRITIVAEVNDMDSDLRERLNTLLEEIEADQSLLLIDLKEFDEDVTTEEMLKDFKGEESI
jgi:hypothetical protein